VSESNERRLEELAESVADGRAVDWRAAEQAAASEEERRAVGALRAISEIASMSRSLQEGAEPAGPPVAPPESWGHLEVLEKVGEGSFGEVYRARDTRLDRVVALKLLSGRGEPGQERTTVEEGRLLARVRHPNVAAVYGADEHDGRTGLWMEFLEGRTLSELLRERGPLGAREAALVGIDLCRALAAVHAQGILHRDVKAQNVVRETGGRIVLTDFGIGRDLEGEEPEPEERRLSGTPLYLAPELFEGEPATVRSDLYSLGVLLYHLATGVFPVAGRSVDEIRRSHEAGEAALLRDVRPDLPLPFIRAVERALARDPARRYLTAGAFEQALSDVVQLDETGSRSAGARPGRRRAVPAVVAVGLLVVLGIASFLVWRGWEIQREAERKQQQELEHRQADARKWYERSQELYSEGNIEGAIAALRHTVDKDPEFAKAHADLGVYLGGVGSHEESSKELSRAFELRDRAADDHERSWILGTYYLDRLNYDKAKEEFNQAVRLDPEDSDSWRQLALLHANLGNAGEGIVPARKARELVPSNVIHHGIYALLLAWADDPDAALSEVAGARKLLSDSEQIVYLAWPEGVAHLLQGDLRAAEEAFQGLANGDSTYASHGRILLAQTLMVEGRMAKAVKELETDRDLEGRKGYDRNGAMRALLLAKAHAILEAPDEVARQLDELEKLPDFPQCLRVLRAAAVLAAETGDIPRAERLAKKIEGIAAAYPSPFARGSAAHVRGEIARAEGDVARSRGHLENARKSWADPATQVSVVRFWLQKGKCGDAESALEEALTSEGQGLGSYFFVWSDLSRLEKDVREQCPAN
jgi:tetratricopeptide (TPR) repeat protein/predicted Ser/Thr protein kinase